MNQGSEQKSANREKNGDHERWRMRLPQREESRCQTSQVKNACANKGERRSGQVVCSVRAGVGANRRRVAAYDRLTALVTAARVLMPLMRGTGIVILVSCARGRRAIRPRCSGTRAKAVYQEREYRDE
jgi:hypothetical protein